MSNLSRLLIQGLRNLAPLDLSIPAHTPILISGDNGAGKTAILEAIHLLATGRSFRESRLQRCQQWQATNTTIFAELHHHESTHQLGWQRQKQTTTLRLDGETAATQASLAWHLPVQVFSPESQDLLTHGPQERRRFIDWGAFYLQDHFLHAWRAYQHALQQRNHALRQQLPEQQVSIWEAPLWQAAQQVDAARQTYCQQLAAIAPQLAGELSESLNQLTLSYHPGWDNTLTLPEIWQQQRAQDRQLGYTQAGPHRADLKLRLQDRDAIAICSRGQQKLLALALLLAQTRLFTLVKQASPVLLLDDLPAELDAQHRQRVLTYLPTLKAQCFFTTTHADLLNLTPPICHWHLHQGQLHD